MFVWRDVEYLPSQITLFIISLYTERIDPIRSDPGMSAHAAFANLFLYASDVCESPSEA